ncbi:MAG: helix-turn-helix domain-containing protein, partial [Tannerella sp.]|nr:helix-turn-helix domain-containing protein [Tannerella sp.]
MKLYNKEEHLACYCYDNGIKPLIEMRTIKKSEADEMEISFNEIVFVLKGKLRFTTNNSFRTEVSKSHFLLLPAGKVIRYRALTDCMVLIVRLQEDIQLCHTYNLERLSNKMKTVDIPELFYTLKINQHVKHFAEGLSSTWEDGLKCRYFFLAKISEFLILLRAYYSEEELYCFFYHTLTSELAFSEFIRTNHLQYPTVNKLADAMHMSPQQFSRRFNIIFGEAPYKWMMREKGRLIYGEICRSKKHLKDIAKEFGFTVQANFNRFCKTEFGLNPGEIRKKKVSEISFSISYTILVPYNVSHI